MDSTHFRLLYPVVGTPSSGRSQGFPSFSPTSSSLLGCSEGILKVWYLDSPTADFLDRRKPLAVLSRHATYVATGLTGGSTVTIANLLSQTPPCFIDTGTTITKLALTGNVLLVLDSEAVAAWLLTKEGVVDGVSAGGRGGRSDSIWTAPEPFNLGFWTAPKLFNLSFWTTPKPFNPWFFVGDQTVVIRHDEWGDCVCAYHTETGEVLEPARTPLPSRGCSVYEVSIGKHHSSYRNLREHDTCSEGNWPVSRVALREGWVKDPGGKRRLWIPVEWRTHLESMGWFDNITTLRLDFRARTVIIVF